MLSYLLPTLLFVSGSHSLVPRASLPPSFDGGSPVVTATSSLPNVYRDGGGGGTIGGFNIIMFCDTTTTNGGQTGQMIGFTTNSIAYSSQSSSQSLTDFGSPAPNQGIPFQANETQFNNDNWNSKGIRVVVWPETSIAPITSQTGVFVVPVATYTKEGQGQTLYNTLVAITPNTTGPAVERVVPQLFYNGEIQWGTAGVLFNQQTQMLNFFAADGGNLKVAQVSADNMADRSKWQYYSNSAWTTTPPAPGSAASIIIQDNISAGDIFWSAYYSTYLFVYMDNWADNTFWLRYSTTGNVEGPWSEGQVLLKITPSSSVFNYAGHAYPDLDGSGKTLLLSWTYGGEYTQMSTITFD